MFFRSFLEIWESDSSLESSSDSKRNEENKEKREGKGISGSASTDDDTQLDAARSLHL